MNDGRKGSEIGRQPWSVPRLRGRGKQGNLVLGIPFSVSALWQRLPLHTLASPAKVKSYPTRLTLLTTASQARRAPRLRRFASERRG
jgi:hypothetical protein